MDSVYCEVGLSLQEARRVRLRAMDTSQTPRTREQLAAAYREAAEEGVRRVSVRWLCDASGVARSTFYTHFSSVEDLAAFVVTEDFERLGAEDSARRAQGTGGAVAARSGLTQVVRMLLERQALLEYSFTETSRPVVVDRMTRWFATYTRDTVAATHVDAEDWEVDRVVDFISAGVIRSVLTWLDSDARSDADRLVDILVSCLPEALRTDTPDRSGT